MSEWLKQHLDTDGWCHYKEIINGSSAALS